MRQATLSGIAATLLTGCSTGLAPPEPLPPPPSESARLPAPRPEGPQAFFPEFPERLLFAVAAAWAGPGQQIVRPDDASLRCESLPPVDAAAALILRYDGTVDDLPRLVTAVSSAPEGGGHLVRTDTYIRVPKRTGGVEVIRLGDAELDRAIRSVLVRAGGRPL
ncbi:hypothetical protein [Histidinibacterium lentulum]|uniref:DUF3576 domain-containing protein n=1 Tax=Histidinibacterium lentulum TaxID=2480588 RepID=A0A3N2R9I1_9RHOB|nr:hypothetical protein [Histidinibacterium lentulum]ROU04041.1 hypothetical protein EAT49_01155 [Histidinibacterium lentulum]